MGLVFFALVAYSIVVATAFCWYSSRPLESKPDSVLAAKPGLKLVDLFAATTYLGLFFAIARTVPRGGTDITLVGLLMTVILVPMGTCFFLECNRLSARGVVGAGRRFVYLVVWLPATITCGFFLASVTVRTGSAYFQYLHDPTDRFWLVFVGSAVASLAALASVFWLRRLNAWIARGTAQCDRVTDHTSDQEEKC
jgi:hypothetical protein